MNMLDINEYIDDVVEKDFRSKDIIDVEFSEEEVDEIVLKS